MKRLNNILLAAAMVCSALTASAIPAMPGVWRMIRLADGTQVRAQLRGDEYGSYWQTADGACYTVKAGTDSLFVKADLKQILSDASVLRSAANADRAKRLAQRNGAPARVGKPTGSYLGKKKGIIIMVEFPEDDKISGFTGKFGTGYNQKYVNGYVNGPLTTGHTRRGFVGTVKDYFLAQSNGQFELDFDVVGPYTLSKPMSYYGANSGNTNDIHRGAMVKEAVTLADADVNYADYDWTGNGYVDQVFILYAGKGEAAGGDASTIWPHESSLTKSDARSSYVSQDTGADGNKVIVNTYACGPELLFASRAGIGTLCHEFAHCLGYPDMYDTSYKGHYGMGYFDLMDLGSYNGDSHCPPNFTAYEKWFAGWITPTVLDKPATVMGLRPQDVNYGETFVINNDYADNEYYLLENRQNTVGVWDKELPASGLQICHIDYDANVWEMNNINSCINYSSQYGPLYAKYDSDHERITIFCADNDRHTDQDEGYKNTSYGDLYPYNGNNELTDSSRPAARIYNYATGGSKYMGKPITNITQNADGTIDFDFMGGDPNNIITGIGGITANTTVKKADNRVYTLDGRCLGDNIDAAGHGVFIQNGKKIVK